jgi:ATP-dependent helicase HrpB
VTIDGVVAVIDSGLARVARHSPWTGVASLQIEPIARASAIQRAGRAGRTAPGACVRLYTRQDFDQRRAFDDPEVQRADLAEVALAVACSGRGRLGALPWFEAPPSAALTAAERLLVRLGAVTEDGAPTPTGRSLAALPVHPRLAAVLRACEDGGAAAEGALMAACLGARELRLERRGRGGQARVASESDVIDDLDAMLDARAGGLRAERLRSAGLDVGTALQVDRAARQLERLCERRGARPRGDAALDEVLQRALLRGFPDRVGRRRAPRGREVVLADGGSATLAETSAVLDAEWMLAIDAAETQRGKAALRRASAIDPGWLLEEFTDQIDDVDELVWNRARTRVERTRALRYGALTIEETSAPVEDLAAAGAILAREALAAGIGAFLDEDELATWRRRVTLVAERTPGLDLRPLDDAQLAAQLAAACAGLTSFAELRGAGLLGLLDASLGPARRTVDERAPTHVRLRGRQVRVNYPADGTPPWIASRMQDFFGLARGPAILGGQLPLVLHLLAPNQRAVQVTQDLPGFWTKHYPGLRNALARRYPRHVWPEDPLTLIEAE